MTRARAYPPANRTAQWWEDKFTRGTMPTIDKLLLHTTETTTWPAYDAGAKAPTVTYNPWVPSAQRWRQHNWLNTSARALQDPSSTPVRENRDNVVQVEIIAYCNPASYRKYGHGVNALPDSAYEDLGAFLAFLHREWSVPLARAPKWATYPPPNSIRMSSATYDAFKGVLGHQHASGNDHGDPGMTAAQVDRILAVAKRLTSTTPSKPTTTTPEDDMSAAEVQDLKNFIEARTQAYAVANNNYTRQVLATATKSILAEINEVDDETAAAVEARLQDEFKALSDQIIAEVTPPAEAPKA